MKLATGRGEQKHVDEVSVVQPFPFRPHLRPVYQQSSGSKDVYAGPLTEHSRNALSPQIPNVALAHKGEKRKDALKRV